MAKKSNAGDLHLLLLLLLLLAEHAGQVLDAGALLLGVVVDGAGVALHRVDEVVHGAASLPASLCCFRVVTDRVRSLALTSLKDKLQH